MKKIFLLLFCICLSLFIKAQTNQVIANGIAAESFPSTNPVDSLNFLSATKKVNGIGVWRKVNLGNIKTWILSGVDTSKFWMTGYGKNYGTIAHLQNTGGYIIVDALSGVVIKSTDVNIQAGGKSVWSMNSSKYGIYNQYGSGTESGFGQTQYSGVKWPSTEQSTASYGDLYHRYANGRYTMYGKSTNWVRFMDSTDLVTAIATIPLADSTFRMRGTTNVQSGFNALFNIGTGINNTATGVASLRTNSNGSNNTSLGYNSMFYNTSGNSNTSIGTNSMSSNTIGNNNVSVGSKSMELSGTSSNNTSIGVSSLNKNNAGNNNTSIGFESMFNNSSGPDNVSIGYNSLYSNNSGNQNVSIGNNSMRLNMTGSDNTVIGYNAGNSANAPGNTIIGSSAYSGNVSGRYNTVLGGYAGNAQSSGNFNVVIGYNTNLENFTGNQQLVIGSDGLKWITGTSSGQVTIPNGLKLLSGSALQIQGTDAIRVPNGTNSERPTSVQFGQIRYNTTIGRGEMYVNDLNGDGTQGDPGWRPI